MLRDGLRPERCGCVWRRREQLHEARSYDTSKSPLIPPTKIHIFVAVRSIREPIRRDPKVSTYKIRQRSKGAGCGRKGQVDVKLSTPSLGHRCASAVNHCMMRFVFEAPVEQLSSKRKSNAERERNDRYILHTFRVLSPPGCLTSVRVLSMPTDPSNPDPSPLNLVLRLSP